MHLPSTSKKKERRADRQHTSIYIPAIDILTKKPWTFDLFTATEKRWLHTPVMHANAKTTGFRTEIALRMRHPYYGTCNDEVGNGAHL